MVRKSIKILLALLVFLLFGVSGAYASASHDHHEAISASPFSETAKNITPHCPLKKRHLNGHVCPHRNAQDNKKEVRIAMDCGGNPNGAVPAQQSFSKNNILSPESFISPALKRAGNLFVPAFVFQQVHLDRIDPPPRS